MEEKIEQIVAEAAGDFSVAVKHMESGQELTINGATHVPLASVFKAPLLVALFQQAAEGEIALDEDVALAEEDRVPGSGVLQELTSGMMITPRDLATLMIIISDNTATDKLLHMVGKDKVQGNMRKLGLDDINIRQSCWELLADCVGVDAPSYSKEDYHRIRDLLEKRKFVHTENLADITNTATAPAMNRLFEQLVSGNQIDEKMSSDMIDILLRQQLRQRIPHQLPPGTKVAHKTGTVGGNVNDSGIIYLPDNNGTVLLTVLSTGNKTADEGAAVISAIAKEVFDYYTE